MSVFNVELKKVVDDSYDIEMGYHLEDQLVEDLETGLLGKIKKFAVITDSNVLDLYAKPISEKLSKAGFKAVSYTHLTLPTILQSAEVLLRIWQDFWQEHMAEAYRLSIMRPHFWQQQMHPWAERLPLIHRLQRI